MAELDRDPLGDEDQGDDSEVVDMGGYTIAKEDPPDMYAHVSDWQSQTGGVVSDG